MRVLVVDDHAVVRKSLVQMLSREPDIEVVGEVANGNFAVEMICLVQPDVVLMDVQMPVLNGIEATRLIHAEFPEVRVIGLSMFPECEQRLREAGAVAYVSKADSTDVLLEAIRSCGPASRPDTGAPAA
jgi:DNA-binding NarL/FixJ family response regulator